MTDLLSPGLESVLSNWKPIPNDEIRRLLPSTYTALENAITLVLLDTSCIAHRNERRLSIDGKNVDRSVNDTCRICLESLAQTLNISHVYSGYSGYPGSAAFGSTNNHDGFTDANSRRSNATSHPISVENEPTVQEPCRCAYHLECLVEWARANLVQQQPVTCPMDRQLLISQDTAAQLINDFRLRAIPDHPIRPITNVTPFWNLLDPSGVYQPNAVFQVGYISPMVILQYASMGCDVGFISASLVNRFDLDPISQRQYQIYSTPRVRSTEFDAITYSQPLYKNYIYLEFNQELDETHQRIQSSYIFVPITQVGGSIFRRYLLGLMGSVYYVQDSKYGILSRQIKLSNHEMISLHAEMRIRRMMKDASRGYDSPAVAISYYPYANEVRNITEGQSFNDRNDPANTYRFDDINIGQSNDENFARLLISQPEARTASDDLVFTYMRHMNFHSRRIQEQGVMLNPFYQINYSPSPLSGDDQKTFVISTSTTIRGP